jgi:hypothetical protein
MQIAAFAGASFYSLGPGLGKRGRRGIFRANCRGPAGGICRGPALALRTTNLFFAPARIANCRRRHLRLQQQQQAIAEPRLDLPVVNG